MLSSLVGWLLFLWWTALFGRRVDRALCSGTGKTDPRLSFGVLSFCRVVGFVSIAHGGERDSAVLSSNVSIGIGVSYNGFFFFDPQ